MILYISCSSVRCRTRPDRRRCYGFVLLVLFFLHGGGVGALTPTNPHAAPPAAPTPAAGALFPLLPDLPVPHHHLRPRIRSEGEETEIAHPPLAPAPSFFMLRPEPRTHWEGLSTEPNPPPAPAHPPQNTLHPNDILAARMARKKICDTCMARATPSLPLAAPKEASGNHKNRLTPPGPVRPLPPTPPHTAVRPPAPRQARPFLRRVRPALRPLLPDRRQRRRRGEPGLLRPRPRLHARRAALFPQGRLGLPRPRRAGAPGGAPRAALARGPAPFRGPGPSRRTCLASPHACLTRLTASPPRPPAQEASAIERVWVACVGGDPQVAAMWLMQVFGAPPAPNFSTPSPPTPPHSSPRTRR